MEEYLSIFIDKEYPIFIDKYLKTNTLNRLKYITQFCGCDYTNLYHPLFLYTRYDHSLVVAHMTWHFTKNKKETIMALLHDVGTPCFAHCIDYVFGDYMNQESAEKKIIDVIGQDKEIVTYLEQDGIALEELEKLANYPILENKSPQLCTDRLDGVLHTCYIWLCTNSFEQIKEVYEDMIVLQNESGIPEIGFKKLEIAEKFVSMVYHYAKELQGNTDKYVMKYISEIVKLAVQKNLLSFEDLYIKKEEEICNLFVSEFSSWKNFVKATSVVEIENKPKDFFSISFDTKKRNVIPLLRTSTGNKRIRDISNSSRKIYNDLEEYTSSKYGYVPKIKKIE